MVARWVRIYSYQAINYYLLKKIQWIIYINIVHICSHFVNKPATQATQNAWHIKFQLSVSGLMLMWDDISFNVAYWLKALQIFHNFFCRKFSHTNFGWQMHLIEDAKFKSDRRWKNQDVNNFPQANIKQHYSHRCEIG